MSRLTQRVANHLRVRLFSHVLDLPVAYIQRVGAGTHLELMGTGGVYLHFWEEQMERVVPTKGP